MYLDFGSECMFLFKVIDYLTFKASDSDTKYTCSFFFNISFDIDLKPCYITFVVVYPAICVIPVTPIVVMIRQSYCP